MYARPQCLVRGTDAIRGQEQVAIVVLDDPQERRNKVVLCQLHSSRDSE